MEYENDEIVVIDNANFTRRPKKTEEGEQIYLLPVYLNVEYFITKTIKTTELTETPSMTDVQIPMLDQETGIQMQYEVTQPDFDENGELVGYIGTGQFLKLWTTELKQETDEEQNLLYWLIVEESNTRSERQPDLEVTEEHSDWTSDLEMAYELFPLTPEPTLPIPTPIHLVVQEQANEIILLSEKNTQLEVQSQVIDERTEGMQAIDDYTLQSQFTIDDRTQGMQEIDDFTLDLVMQMQIIIDAQTQQITTMQQQIAQLQGGT